MKWIFLSLFLIFGSSQGNKKELEIDEKEKVDTLTETKLKFLGTQTPESYIKSENVYTDTWNQILLGIKIENHSKYTLGKPIFTPGSLNNLTQLKAVESKSLEFFVLDNFNGTQNYVYGSLVWEIFLEGKSQKYRIVLTFEMPWK